MENPYLSVPSPPKWPFGLDDEVTEGRCSNIITKTGKRLSTALKSARADSAGPFFREENLSGQVRRVYLWKDVVEWLGPEDTGLLYFDPDPCLRRYTTDDPNISSLRDAYDSERRRRSELESQIRLMSRPRPTCIGLLSEATILSIGYDIRQMSGIYFLIDGDEIVYVGQSLNVHRRITDHFHEKQFTRVAVVPVSQENLDELEGSYINLLSPKYNKTMSP